jgi:hypothetical protein
MLIVGRPARPAIAMEKWPRLRPSHAYEAAPADPQKRIARLRELAGDFRRVLKEMTIFDGLHETLRTVIRDLEEEAERLERNQRES